MQIKPNHLAQESSPYLQQHAFNPVDWYPWGSKALEKARRENKPILLSIGYAACHWCHVMAHESFEDVETAQLMNELFVNIKVDREERPELDKIYQTAHYLLTRQNGGWPLTVFLTPDCVPYFSGTYFPREARYQLPAFKEVLKAIADLYQQRPDDIKKQNDELLSIVTREKPTLKPMQLNDKPLQLGFQALKQTYDDTYGGFGHAPKFPQPTKLVFLLPSQSEMALYTLQQLSLGGICDQLGGGFFRYAIDDAWHIPHFEKMLYDNAQLLWLYAHAAILYSRPDFAEEARHIAHFILQNMQSSAGGFFSSISADSEGHEGKFYVWEKSEVEKILTPDEYAIVSLYFGLDKPANFDEYWHFYIREPLSSIAELRHLTIDTANILLQSAKEKLLNVRNKRISPDRDQKILTAWNGLMIKGLLSAGFLLDEPQWLDIGHQALSFIQTNLWHDQRLFANYMHDQATIPALLDDYVFLLDAILSALQTTWCTKKLLFAIELADNLLARFFDHTHGGFYFTPNDHEKLLFRPKTMMDEAIPSGNGIAVQVFLKLGHLLGETKYLTAAEKTLQAAWPYMVQFPAEHCTLLDGLKYYLHPANMIIIRGKADDIKRWQKAGNRIRDIIFAIPSEEEGLPGGLSLKKPHNNTCAYICQGLQCSKPIEDFEVFRKHAIS